MSSIFFQDHDSDQDSVPSRTGWDSDEPSMLKPQEMRAPFFILQGSMWLSPRPVG